MIPERIHRRAAICALAGAVTACRSTRAVPFPGFAYIANYDAHTVAVVDLSAFSVKKQIHLDEAPSALTLHPSKNLVYALTPVSGTVWEIDGTTFAISRQVKVAPSAAGMQIASPNGPPGLWVLGEDGLKRLALDTLKISDQIGLSAQPDAFDLSMWGELAAVSYGSTGSVVLVDLAKRHAGPQIRLSESIGAIRFRSDGKMLIVADLAGRTLVLVDAPSGRLVSRLPLAVRPDHFCFSADQGQLFVTGEGRDAVVVVYPYNVPEVAETSLAGRAPGAMAASKNYLFVTNPTTGDVSIFNVANRKTIAIAAVGSEPSYVAITPDDQYALILNQASGDVAVIRIPGIKAERTGKDKTASLFTMIPVGSKPVAAVIQKV